MDCQQTDTFSHQVEHSLWYKIATVEKLYQQQDETLQTGKKIEDCKLGLFRTNLLLEIYKIQNQQQAEYCAHWDQTFVPIS